MKKLTIMFVVFFVASICVSFHSSFYSNVFSKPVKTAWTLKVVNVVQHTVKKGEDLKKIASKYGVTVEDIIASNGIKDPNSIKPGQKIKIPLKKINGEVLI